jgi:CotS family spore coat protein
VNDDELREEMQPIGMDPEVLHVYNCQPARVRAVRGVLKVRTPYGPWALKKVHTSPEQLDVVYRLTEHVAKAGSFMVPRFIRTRHGDPYVIHPTGLYYMTPWLSGREADLRKPVHLIAATRLMAFWHAAARGFQGFHEEPSATLRVLGRLETGKNMFRLLVGKGKQTGRQSPFIRMVLASEDELMERIHIAKGRLLEAGFLELEQTPHTTLTVCHGRFLKKNILFDGESYTVANYDHVETGLPIAELCFYLHRYLPAYEWDEQILLESVRAYHAIQPFDRLQLSRLSAALSVPFRPLQIISWYQNREVMWQEEDYIDAFELALDLEEARAGAADALCDLFRMPLIDQGGGHHDGVDLASSRGGNVEMTAPVGGADAGKRKPRRRKKPPLRQAGPTILSPSGSGFPPQIDLSGSADEHGNEDDEQEHQDK